MGGMYIPHNSVNGSTIHYRNHFWGRLMRNDFGTRCQPAVLGRLQNFFSKSENIDNILGIPKRLPIFLKSEKKFCKKFSAGIFHIRAQKVTH